MRYTTIVVEVHRRREPPAIRDLGESSANEPRPLAKLMLRVRVQRSEWCIRNPSLSTGPAEPRFSLYGVQSQNDARHSLTWNRLRAVVADNDAGVRVLVQPGAPGRRDGTTKRLERSAFE